MTRVSFRQNDVGNVLPVQLVNWDGELPRNLTGYTVKFKMWTAGIPGTPKINAAATKTDEENGMVEYAFTGTDLDTVGSYLAEFQIEKTSVKESSEIVEVEITESPS